MQFLKRGWACWQALVLHPLFATAVTVLIILAGGLFGIYPDEIKNAFPFHPFARGPLVWHAVIAWAFALAAALGFFFRQRADDEKREAAQQQLVKQAATLEELIRTLPPVKFLDSFALLHGTCDDTVSDILNNAPLDLAQVDQAVRLVLRAIASLARIFDGDDQSIRYAANVMIFKPSESMSADEKLSVIDRLKFCEEGVSVDNLEGVLDLEPALTASTDDADSVDDKVERIALPIPRTLKENGLFKVLPGAPLAFKFDIIDIHTDFQRLVAWCNDLGDFSHSVKERLGKYLESKRGQMQSFLSIPLKTRDETPRKIGILNIHCERVGMLHDHKGAVAQFTTVVKPLQLLLVKLLAVRTSGIKASASERPLRQDSDFAVPVS